MAIRNAVGFLGGGGDLPEGFWYSVKRRVLGPPMVNEQLRHQRLSKVLALGVLFFLTRLSGSEIPSAGPLSDAKRTPLRQTPKTGFDRCCRKSLLGVTSITTPVFGKRGSHSRCSGGAP